MCWLFTGTRTRGAVIFLTTLLDTSLPIFSTNIAKTLPKTKSIKTDLWSIVETKPLSHPPIFWTVRMKEDGEQQALCCSYLDLYHHIIKFFLQTPIQTNDIYLFNMVFAHVVNNKKNTVTHLHLHISLTLLSVYADWILGKYFNKLL